MTVPGSNLLARASKLIKLQAVDYFQDAGRANNDIGLDVTAYLPSVSISGSVQAVPLTNYKDMGLDLGKNYVILYSATPLLGVSRDVSGDVFAYNNRVYQVESPTDWLAQDGWNSVLAVQTDLTVPQVMNFVVTPDGIFVGFPSGS